MDQDADSVPEKEEGNTATKLYASGCIGPAQSKNPRTLRTNLHENRKISSVPWSDDQGRSAKAMNRTADMHALEKSDCAVVLMNQPNKEGQPSTEVGEGRAQAKENIVQSRKPPTQSGKHMSQGLHGVQKAGRERKQERFTSRFHSLRCWQRFA